VIIGLATRTNLSSGYGPTDGAIVARRRPIYARQASGFFKGTVDEVALWKRHLTQSEIRAIHAAGAAGVSLETLMTQSAVAEWSLY
jgi:hypothetical protein